MCSSDLPILFSLAAGIHWSVAAATPAMALLALAGLWRGPRRAWIVGLGLGAALWIPFGLYLADVGAEAYFRRLAAAPSRRLWG